MAYLVHPIALMFAGPLAGFLVGRLLAGKLILRGYLVWALVTGSVAMLGVLAIWNFALSGYFRDSFSDYGPCSLCSEWSFLGYLIWWVSWVAGAIIFLSMSVLAIVRMPEDIPRHYWRWPKNVLPWSVGSILVLVALVVGIRLAREANRASLAARMGDAQVEFDGSQLGELGAIQLPERFSWIDQTPPFVEPGGIHFGDSEDWMLLSYEDKLEIWSLTELTLEQSFDADSAHWRGVGALSPDGNMAAIWEDGDTSVFSLSNKGISPLWQTDSFTELRAEIVFGEDGKELILLDRTGLVRVRSRDGEIIATSDLNLPTGYHNLTLSNYGEHLAIRMDNVIRVYDTGTGRPLHQLEVELPAEGRSEISGTLKFLPDGDLLFWSFQRDSEVRQTIWSLRTGTAAELEFSFNFIEYFDLAFSPDSRYAVVASRQDSEIWDLKNHRLVGSIPVDSAITALEFTPDQTRLAVATASGHLRFYASPQG